VLGKQAHRHDNAGRLWVEEGDDVSGPVVTVAPIAPIDKTYSFAVPPGLDVRPGQRINVPIGRTGRIVPAFCLTVDQQEWDSTLKPVDSLLDTESYLTEDLLELGRWIARYYACPLGKALAALVPSAVHKKSGSRVRKQLRLALLLSEIDVLPTASRMGAKQRSVLEYLAENNEWCDLPTALDQTGASRSTVQSLLRKEWVVVREMRVPADCPNFDQPRAEPEFDLNEYQHAAVQRITAMIDQDRFRVAMLHGVSGSGKTEVYIHAMRHVLDQRRQVMLLVPEIALTTQLVQRLASRFENVAVIHSGLTGVQRSLIWSAIRRGGKTVIIGTRSAVFAPSPNLGLIVVDEEQETSYKNLQAPRFHVRDVAVKRAQQLGIVAVLGSATPSLETWCNCDRLDHFERIELPRRVRDLPLPTLTVVNMEDEYSERTGTPLLSRVTLQRLGDTFKRNEQAVLLMNRRGYANHLLCPSCKHRIRCPHCNVPMVFHAAANQIVCHHCSRREQAPTHCPDPSCRSRLKTVGSGTERIVAVLEKWFPAARIVRVDRDTMRHERSYRRLVSDFEQRKIDCIVGTQMIAKGLDFPYVSFVAVIGADTTLSAPDFRTGERLFQLITQVAGRAGRADTRGDVVIQTLSPNDVSLRAAVNHDYHAFASEELDLRRKMRMPPFTRLARVVMADVDDRKVKQEASHLADRIRSAIRDSGLTGCDVLGPLPCVLARLRNRYRHEVIARSESAAGLQRLLDELRARKVFQVRAQSFFIDVDPVSMS